MNILTAAELKRRGMAAIEEGLRRGPIHIVKRNRPTAVVLSEDEYARLAQNKAVAPTGMTALQWLLSHPSTKARKKASVALDGVSLTVSSVSDDGFAVSLIPETLERTNLGRISEGAPVNIEVDILAKHVERLDRK